MDFSRYKNRLIEYLHLRGHNVKIGSDFCFNPDHDNHDTPAAQYNDENFMCYSGNCGIHGDIYDAVGILEGIPERKEQYIFLEKLFGGGYEPPPQKPRAEKEKEQFTPDPNAEKELENYLKKNVAAEKEIERFLNMRAAASSLGTIKEYPADLLPLLVKQFLYWPGLDLVRKDISTDTLRRCGVPLTNPKTGTSWWEHSGVILKLGTGYKLNYYIEGQCKKFGSKGSSTFPMPGTIDKTKPVIIVEGEIDAVSSNVIGIENLFSAGGTNGITGPKIKKYLLDVPEIILFFDADDAGRKASGLIPLDVNDAKRTNLPEIIRRAGFTGKIRIAELPIAEQYKDQDALIIAGKRDIVKKAIQEAKEYIPPEKKAEGKEGVKWDFLTLKRIQSILKKLPREELAVFQEGVYLQAFVTGIFKAGKNKNDVEKELKKWGATKEELENKNDFSPYDLIEISWLVGLSKYLQRVIKIELTPASELLKKINLHKPIINIDYDELKENKNLSQFMDYRGVRSAALLVSDILDGAIIYVATNERFYFYNDHVWNHEPDMTGVIFNIISAIVYYLLEHSIYSKTDCTEIIDKIESRHFRMEVTKEFSQLKDDGVWKEYINFDGPAVKETLTLIDGIMDFSGDKIIYRKSKREEYRQEILPYKIEDFQNNIEPTLFYEFMRGNFKNEDTLETLMYFLSLIPSRNTQFKTAGFFIGKTNTGKTTTISIMEAIYPQMIQGLPSSVLVGKGERHLNGNQANPYLAQLEGKGAGVINETERNSYLNTGLFKEITGGGTIITRDLYKTAHPFLPTAQIIMTTNDPPRFDSHDTASIERMIIIPFMIQHDKEKEKNIQPDEFIDKFRHEFPAIIRVFAEYYIKLKTEHNRLIPLSDECKRYKGNYVEDQDTDLDKFVKDSIEFTISEDKQSFEKVKDVYNRYLKYYGFMDDFGNTNETIKEALTQNKFTRYIKRDYMTWGLNYKQKKINGAPELVFLNMRLKPWNGEAKESTPTDTVKERKEPEQKDFAAPPDENPFD